MIGVPLPPPPQAKVTPLLPMSPLPSLDLQPGLGLQVAIWKKFRKPIGFSKEFSMKEFFLMASFDRCKFWLYASLVGYLLQGALGGSTLDFNVIQIVDRVCKFSVSCREVGFLINQLHSYQCDSFIVFFNLWNNGGAN
jgi:hypothetical protein